MTVLDKLEQYCSRSPALECGNFGGETNRSQLNSVSAKRKNKKEAYPMFRISRLTILIGCLCIPALLALIAICSSLGILPLTDQQLKVLFLAGTGSVIGTCLGTIATMIFGHHGQSGGGSGLKRARRLLRAIVRKTKEFLGVATMTARYAGATLHIALASVWAVVLCNGWVIFLASSFEEAASRLMWWSFVVVFGWSLLFNEHMYPTSSVATD